MNQWMKLAHPVRRLMVLLGLGVKVVFGSGILSGGETKKLMFGG